MLNGKIWVSEHTGKMEGIGSISTWCGSNPNCVARAKNPDSICSKCYARRMSYRHSLIDRLKNNTEVLSSEVLKEDDLPFINSSYFRFESFGDLINKTHLINYMNICQKNPQCTFALWTKNFWIVDDVLEEYEKPENLLIVASSGQMNKELDRVPAWADSVFTVYDKDFSKENEVEINCGSRSCLICRKCYTKHEGVMHIHELLK